MPPAKSHVTSYTEYARRDSFPRCASNAVSATAKKSRWTRQFPTFSKQRWRCFTKSYVRLFSQKEWHLLDFSSRIGIVHTLGIDIVFIRVHRYCLLLSLRHFSLVFARLFASRMGGQNPRYLIAGLHCHWTPLIFSSWCVSHPHSSHQWIQWLWVFKARHTWAK